MTDLDRPNQTTQTVAAQPAVAAANFSELPRPAAGAMPDAFAPAIAYREAGDYPRAESWLTEHLLAQPNDAQALAHLAHIQMLRKRDAAAHATLVHAEAIAPDDPLILRNRARLALRAQKIEVAASAAARALAADPAGVENRLVQAVVLGVQGETERALEVMDALLTERPDFAEALANRMVLHLRGRNVAAAMADANRALEIKPHLSQPWRLLAIIHAQAMRTGDALAALRRYCELEPEDAVALAEFGELLRQRDLTEEALKILSRAIEIAPNLVAAWVNYGTALQQAKRADDAVTAYEKALALKPDLAEVHNNLGIALKEQGKLDEAVARYEQALACKPDFAEAHNNLGTVLKDQGKLDEAVACYRRALVLKPDFVEAHSNLGNALKDQGKLEEAIAVYRQAISIKPDYAEAHNNLGSALKDQGKLDEAVACYRRALVLKPDFAEVHSNLGNALKDQGKLDEAVACYRRAIGINPDLAAAYLLLADVKRFAATDPHLAAMEKLARDMASLSAENQIDLHFALAKAYADIGDYTRSFRNLMQGNALKRQRISYNEADTHDLFRRIQDVFTLALMRGKQDLGDPSSKPVFIIGMPRSGTTLIEQILASHPSVYGAGELDYMPNEVAKLNGREAASMRFPEAVSSMTDEQLRQLGASYISSISTLAPHAERIADKLPINFLFAGLIHLALPNARLIHTRRDPIDTCVSCFSRLFSEGHAYSYDLAELGGYYRAYEALMEHWRKVLPPGVMLEVQYENVTADLEAEARRMIAHCGLEWDDACLSFHQTERPVRSTFQVRQPIYRNSVGRWRLYERHLGPLIGALGLHFGRGSESEPAALAQAGVATTPMPCADTPRGAPVSVADDAERSMPDARRKVAGHSGEE